MKEEPEDHRKIWPPHKRLPYAFAASLSAASMVYTGLSGYFLVSTGLLFLTGFILWLWNRRYEQERTRYYNAKDYNGS